jgi:type II secretory pathway pseudopilin PulG
MNIVTKSIVGIAVAIGAIGVLGAISDDPKDAEQQITQQEVLLTQQEVLQGQEYILKNVNAKTNLQSKKYPNQPDTEVIEKIKLDYNKNANTINLSYTHRDFFEANNNVRIDVQNKNGTLVGSETISKTDKVNPDGVYGRSGVENLTTKTTYDIEFNPSNEKLYLKRTIILYEDDIPTTKQTYLIGDKTTKFSDTDVELKAVKKASPELRQAQRAKARQDAIQFFTTQAGTVWDLGKLGHSRSSMINSLNQGLYNDVTKAIIDLYWNLGNNTADYYTRREFQSMVQSGLEQNMK